MIVNLSPEMFLPPYQEDLKCLVMSGEQKSYTYDTYVPSSSANPTLSFLKYSNSIKTFIPFNPPNSSSVNTQTQSNSNNTY